MKKLTLDEAYMALVNDADFPRQYLPGSEELRETPVMAANLRDVPLFKDEDLGISEGEDVPAMAQRDLFYKG